MSCPSIITIPDTECIGNSLTTINNNFSAIEVATCNNYSKINSLQQDILTLNNLITNLTNITVPGTAKAWISFNGKLNAQGQVSTVAEPRFINSSYNIQEVFRYSIGYYRLTFTTRLQTSNYAVIGTNKQTTASANNYTWVQPFNKNTTGDFEIKINSNTDTLADPENVSLLII